VAPFAISENAHKLPAQRFGMVENNLKPAALGRGLWSEGADDHIATVPHCTGNLPCVGNTVARCRQEMKDGVIMPNIVSRRWLVALRDICNQPVHSVRGIAQPFPVRINLQSAKCRAP